MSDDKLTSDEVFDILKGSMPIALAGYLMDAVHPLGREGLEMVQAVREAAAAEERIKVEAQAAEISELRAVVDALLQHEASSFFGPDEGKHKRASWRGVIRKAKKARAGKAGQ